ncbi:MAG: Lrp/AsnC family transcriptional regulator [Pseudomonadota bacterium]
MDQLDWKIVSLLESDGRISFAELAERIGLSKSPCWNRVQRLRNDGVVTGYVAQLDPPSLGLGVLCHISITIGHNAHSDFEAAVCDHAAIMECYTTAGSSDYLLRVYASSVEHLDDLLRNDISKLPGVQSSSTTICLKTIKRSGSLAALAQELT